MRKTIFLFLSIPLLVFYSCDSDDHNIINYVSFESTSYDFGVDIQSSNSNDIKIYTTRISNVERVFNINIDTDMSTADPASYTVPGSVSVPANSNEGVFTVNISDLNIGAEGETLVLSFTNEEGLFIGDPITFNIKQICPYPETQLAITFDDFPEEQYWELYDSNDDLLFEGGPYPDETEFSRGFCLENGTYKIVMGDTFGDGGGGYTITYNGNVLVTGDGNHGFSEELTFQINN
ncbi:hypothetical protein [Flavivirga rizhaonensis]|uniref:DUF1735 domain-containing protein n=1 Tax=Flavivirga rizhaonensis TaxID=2559571 RepID=A0A4S1DWF0_9FLAO|nr:hypothetical protein [Flavivirga rizhaonensis]TGV02450.1 hypothetical protein EM932_10890 [Flavivirga rizhaonensis]